MTNFVAVHCIFKTHTYYVFCKHSIILDDRALYIIKSSMKVNQRVVDKPILIQCHSMIYFFIYSHFFINTSWVIVFPVWPPNENVFVGNSVANSKSEKLIEANVSGSLYTVNISLTRKFDKNNNNKKHSTTHNLWNARSVQPWSNYSSSEQARPYPLVSYAHF